MHIIDAIIKKLFELPFQLHYTTLITFHLIRVTIFLFREGKINLHNFREEN